MTVHIQQAGVEQLFRKIVKQRILLDRADFILQERLEGQLLVAIFRLTNNYSTIKVGVQQEMIDSQRGA